MAYDQVLKYIKGASLNRYKLYFILHLYDNPLPNFYFHILFYCHVSALKVKLSESEYVFIYKNSFLFAAFIAGPCKVNSSTVQLLSGAMHTVQHDKMDTESCVKHCNIFSLKYSATSNTNTCTCGSILNPNSLNTTCDKTCAGKPSENCGGPAGAANLVTASVVAKMAYRK